MLPEPDRFVEALGHRILVVAPAEHDRALSAGVAKALQREEVDRAPEPAPTVVGVRADGLELADAVLVVVPRERVRRERAVGRLDDAGRPIAIPPRFTKRLVAASIAVMLSLVALTWWLTWRPAPAAKRLAGPIEGELDIIFSRIDAEEL